MEIYEKTAKDEIKNFGSDVLQIVEFYFLFFYKSTKIKMVNFF